ncbi:MAG: hypothetical protein HYX53_17670 [Chloroflexi bacterium]|nr:hypothetical protein [Chloroflexota bacterium]
MNGDFSRETFDPKRHYSRVLMQQGRVQLDADWNEQGAIAGYLAETQGTDVIGPCGAPIGNAGFEITTDGTNLKIGAGRFYAHGILVENDSGGIDFDAQPDFPGASLKDALTGMAARKRTIAIAYLDVWRRHVTPLDDHLLREVALGGPDTTTRLKTVWQVRLLPVAAGGGRASEIDSLTTQHSELGSKLADIDTRFTAVDADIVQRQAELAAMPATGAARTTLARAIQRLQAQREQAQGQRVELAAAAAEIKARLDDLRAKATVHCSTRFDEWDALSGPGGQLNARAKPGDPADDPCELPPGAGYTRLENQLYRVEVHEPGALGKATFKWSRDNGTVATAIAKISGSSVFVHDLGPDEVLGFANGQWVELSDDARELNGLPGQLARIVDVKPATNELVLNPAPQPLASGTAGVDPALRPKLRRWDQVNQAAAPADQHGVATSAGWLPLEDGVEVQFSGGPFATGDYWLVPARTATGDLEWPPFEVPNTGPLPQFRRGIHHHYCRLALLNVDGEKLKVVEDCRELFPPLTDLLSGAVKPALHVIQASWENDTSLDMQAFLKDGLRIRLDGPPAAASISNDSILVTLDIPYQPTGGTAVPSVRERLLLLGTPGLDTADPQTIVWRWDPGTGGVTLGRASGTTVGGLTTAAAATPSFRLNLTLRGHVIWQEKGNARLYLDGQAFAQPVTDPATGAVRTALILPSGDGVRASDFESWFFLGPAQTGVAPLRVAKLEFISLNPTAAPILTIDSLPPDPAKPVQVFADTTVARIRATLSREAQAEGEFGPGVPQPAFIETVPPRGAAKRLAAVATVKSNQVEVRAQDPQALPAGNYRLTILSQGADAATGLRGASDGSPLDGAFDGKGANFTLAFAVVPRP